LDCDAVFSKQRKIHQPKRYDRTSFLRYLMWFVPFLNKKKREWEQRTWDVVCKRFAGCDDPEFCSYCQVSILHLPFDIT
jgi:hypothetical protein